MTDPLKIMDEIEREKHYNCAPLNIERLRQSADKIRDNARQGLICAAWQAGIQRWAADTIEAQAEELEQKDARIGRLHDAIEDTINLCNLTGDEAITTDEDLLRAEKIRDETEDQSLAAVKAEALREAARNLPNRTEGMPPTHWLALEADRIEQEAKEEP